MNTDCVKICSFESWYPRFEKITIESRIIELPDEFIKYLNEDKIFVPRDYVKKPRDDDISVSASSSESSELNNSDEEEQFAPEFSELEEIVNTEIQNLKGSVFPKTNWSSPKDAVWLNCDNSLKCRNFNEIVLLFKSSDFICHDINNAFDFCDADDSEETFKTMKMYLVLRRWMDINPMYEFRCFVKRRQIFAISQRSIDSYYEDLAPLMKEIKEKISKFFYKHIAEQFPLMSCKFNNQFQFFQDTFDVYLTKTNEVKLIDFNVYGQPTEPLLFNYKKLEQISAAQLTTNQIEFNIQTNVGIKSSEMSAYKVPVDLSEISLGNIPPELEDLFKTHIDMQNLMPN